MKFYIENHSVRMHVLDRDVRAGAGCQAGIPAVEYTPEELEKSAKCISSAMGTMVHFLVNGYAQDGSKKHKDPELKVFCEHEGKRYELSQEDVRDFKAPEAEEDLARAAEAAKTAKAELDKDALIQSLKAQVATLAPKAKADREKDALIESLKVQVATLAPKADTKPEDPPKPAK